VSDHEDSPGDAGPYTEGMAAFVERFAADLTQAGMQRMAARVYACLLAADEPVLSAADLAARLRISPAAVSGAVRYLAQVNLISREREPGSRRERYRLYDESWYEALLRRDTLLERLAGTMRAGVDLLGADRPGARRMAETAAFMDYLESELRGVLDRWREQRARRGGDTP
jgi:predicted transcriptional regulator